jgi:serine protease Do
MRILLLALALALALAPGFLLAGTPDRGVVRIEGRTVSKEGSGGLGFIVEKEGFLLTTYRNLVVPGTEDLHDSFVVRSGKTEYLAEVIGVEPTIDLAILKLETEDSFTPVIAATKREIIPGQSLEAAAFEENGTFSPIQGDVTALNTKQCYQHSLASTMFRALITIPRESIGGPVFHADTGEVAAIYTGFKPIPAPGHEEVEGETHLLPIELCFNIYESLKTKRSLKSPWTGFSVRPLTDAERAFFPTAKKHHGGVAVEEVWENSPAQKMGVKEGDILVQFSYNRILSVADFQKWLYMYGVGHPVKLMFLRNGTDYLATDYTIEERPKWAKPK